MYSAVRRPGLAGRIGVLRAAVYADGSDQPVLRARSPGVARMLAQLLNGEELAKRVVEERAPSPRYTTMVVARTGRTLITAQSTTRRRGALGDGPIAETDDADLARRLAALLNEIDPLPKARASGQF